MSSHVEGLTCDRKGCAGPRDYQVQFRMKSLDHQHTVPAITGLYVCGPCRKDVGADTELQWGLIETVERALQRIGSMLPDPATFEFVFEPVQ